MGDKILSQLEKLAFWLQLRYMRSKRTTEVVEAGRICFHPQDCREEVIKKYGRTLKNLRIG